MIRVCEKLQGLNLVRIFKPLLSLLNSIPVVIHRTTRIGFSKDIKPLTQNYKDLV